MEKTATITNEHFANTMAEASAAAIAEVNKSFGDEFDSNLAVLLTLFSVRIFNYANTLIFNKKGDEE